MPELPDLQVFSRNLTKQLSGAIVKKVAISNTGKISSPNNIKKALTGRRLSKVKREGKELHFLFNDDVTLGMHLMLHGRLYLGKGGDAQKHVIASLLFSDDRSLTLTDFQRQAVVRLNPEVKPSPDALDRRVNAKFLGEQMSATRTNVKNLLMDQDVVRGIGNAYADEILWQARLSPFSVCTKVPPAKVKQLALAIKRVLKNAEKKILKDHPGIISGEYREFLVIHNAKKKESPGGATILHKTLNSRKTYYTEEQELYR